MFQLFFASPGTRIGRYVVDNSAVPMPAPAPPSAAGPASVTMSQTPPVGSPASARPSSPAPAASDRLQYSATASASQTAYVNPAFQCPDSFMVRDPSLFSSPLFCRGETILFSCLLRLTLHSQAFSQQVVPTNAALQQKSKLPFGVALHPMCPSEAVPLVNMGAVGIVRCKTCRAYMNPFVEWIEGGRRWRCNLCGIVNDVSGAYFSPLDANGVRLDAPKRPELSNGIVDLVAPAEYMVRPPMAPAYLFVLDVSYYAVQSGMTASVLKVRCFVGIANDCERVPSCSSSSHSPPPSRAFERR